MNLGHIIKMFCSVSTLLLLFSCASIYNFENKYNRVGWMSNGYILDSHNHVCAYYKNGYILVDGNVEGFYNNGRIYDKGMNQIGYYSFNYIYIQKNINFSTHTLKSPYYEKTYNDR